MPVLDFGAEDALRLAEAASPRAARPPEGEQDTTSAEWQKMQTSIASLQALGVLKDPAKRGRRSSLPAISSQEKTRAVTGPPDLNPEDLLELEDGLPRLASAQVGMPTPPSRTALRAPDASKFMKIFEQTQSIQQAATTAPGPGGFARRGRRWTVVSNQVHAMANIKPPEEDAKLSPSERSINRNSVRLSNLPPSQRASTALPQGSRGSKAGNLDELFDDGELDLKVNAASSSTDARTWKGWYKIQSKAKTDAEELEGAFGAPAPTSVLESLTAAPAQTGASQQVVEAAKAWGAIREESAAEMEEHTNFADGLPPGIGKLAAMLVNRFGSLERAFCNFDYNRKGKITRGQWQTVFATVRIDVQEATNIPSKKVFRMIASLGNAASTLEITFDQWRDFFEQNLADGECSFLLAEDRGTQAPKRWAQVKKMVPKALKVLVEHIDEVEKEASALREYISGEDGQDIEPAEMDGWSSDSEASSDSDGEEAGSSRHRDKAKRGEDGEQDGSSASDGEEAASASCRSLKRGTEEGSATASSAVGEPQGEDAEDAASSAALPTSTSTEPPKAHGSHALDDSSSDSEAEGAAAEAPSKGGKKADHQHSGVDARRVNRDKVMKAFQERDDTAIAQLNDDELQALAEQVQLQEEIEQFDLSSMDAFAYVLLAKMGSFKRAFRWFDFNCSKKITNVTWDTGILLLHVDTEKLTGLKPSQIFYRMDTCTEAPPSGTITRKKWKFFFSGFKIPEELQKQLEEGKTLRKRAAARMKQYRRRGSLFRGDRGQRLEVKRRDSESESEPEETEEERRLRQAQEEENYREWVERELASIADGDFRDYSDSMFRGGAESLLNPFRRRQIMLQVAEAFGLYTLSPAGYGRVPPRNSTSLERAPGIVESAIMPDSGCMRIYNMQSHTAALIAKFEEVKKGGRLVLNDIGYTEAQKAVAHLVALDRSLVAVFEKWGAGERLVVHDTGSFASGLNSQLDSLSEGDSLSLATNLSNIELKYVQAQAAKMGMTVIRQKNENGEEFLKVFNMNDFANTVREKLADVGVGSRAIFKKLCLQEREVVHTVAREMGLHSLEAEGDSLKNVIVLSNVEFLAEQAARISQAADAGGGEFILPQTAQQQKDFWEMADKNGLELDTSYHGHSARRSDFKNGDVVRLAMAKSRDGSSASDGEAEDEILTGKPGLKPGSEELAEDLTDEQRAERAAVDIQKSATLAGPTIQTSSELIRQAFDAYATGNHRGERTFLRYVDLKEFADDLRSAMPGRQNSFRDFGIILELCFDDTTQLQSDFGIRVGPGLTHQFFQVFIQKAMSRLGLQVASVLFEILNEHS
ncbi:SEC1A [Symbiodinium natans]|uniref:SEC1A protein n=1 Tax=Symbiodinium natans TaxID=878477 RepID=A0A812ULX7_9DINO|nr:SEC1A [Symbiodinium natans]